MTKKHFKAIAAAINAQRLRPYGDKYADVVDARLDALAEDLATWLKTQNPNFQRQKFLDACGVEE